MAFTDQDLLLRVIADDDRHAFGELVKRHQSAVRNFLRRLTRGDDARADDLAQETFLKAHRAVATFRGDAAFSTWLHRIAYRVFLNDRRSQRSTVVFDETHAPADELSHARHTDLAHDLQHAFSRLSDEQVAVFDLTYRKGLSHTEVAVALELPLGTVKTRLARGLATLRQALQDWKTHHA